MLTKSLICIVLISAAIVQANAIKAASRSDRSAYEPADSMNVNYHITYDLSGYPVSVHESNGDGGKADRVDKKSKVGIGGFLTSIGKHVNNAIDEGVSNHGKKVNSFLDIGRSALDAVKTSVDSKVKLVASVPKVGFNVLEDAGRK